MTVSPTRGRVSRVSHWLWQARALVRISGVLEQPANPNKHVAFCEIFDQGPKTRCPMCPERNPGRVLSRGTKTRGSETSVLAWEFPHGFATLWWVLQAFCFYSRVAIVKEWNAGVVTFMFRSSSHCEPWNQMIWSLAIPQFSDCASQMLNMVRICKNSWIATFSPNLPTSRNCLRKKPCIAMFKSAPCIPQVAWLVLDAVAQELVGVPRSCRFFPWLKPRKWCWNNFWFWFFTKMNQAQLWIVPTQFIISHFGDFES